MKKTHYRFLPETLRMPGRKPGLIRKTGNKQATFYHPNHTYGGLMGFYVRRFNSIGYFIGYSISLQPMVGPPDWAIRFSSVKEAYDQFPSVLHGTIEVVSENARTVDIEQFRFQNIDVPEPFAHENPDSPPF